jgi:molecular chaperone GrpE (heat shock protein)
MHDRKADLTDEEQLRLLRREFAILQRRADCERKAVEQKVSEELRSRLRPLAADLERVLEDACAADVEPMYRTGVSLILRQLLEALTERAGS